MYLWKLKKLQVNICPLLTLRVCARVTVVVLWVCMCVSVTTLATTYMYLVFFYVVNKVPLSFLWHVLDMYCVDFFENALFWSSGDICCAPLPSLLLNELSTNKRYSDGFFSRRLLCRSCGSSYNSTGSSLVIANCQLKLCVLFVIVCQNLQVWQQTRGSIYSYVLYIGYRKNSWG